MRTSLALVLATILGALASLAAPARAAVSPTISRAIPGSFYYGMRYLTIEGSFPVPQSCADETHGQRFPFVSCYSVEVACNSAIFPAEITSFTTTRITVRFPQRPSSLQAGAGSRCAVNAIAHDRDAGRVESGEHYLGYISPPPIEIHDTQQLTFSGSTRRYRLFGYFPAGGAFGAVVTCDGVPATSVWITSALLDQLDIVFSVSNGQSKSCTFEITRSNDSAATPVWHERVDGPRVGSAALHPAIGAYHWGGFEPDWMNRDRSVLVAVQRMQEAGLRGPIRFVLSPQQRTTTVNNGSVYSPKFDWYDDYGQGYSTDPRCANHGLWDAPFAPYLPYAVCSSRLQAAFDAIPVLSTVILTTLDSTSSGPYGNEQNYASSWMLFHVDDVSDEYYRLAKALLITQAGTGKTFIISNWEADNLIFCGAAFGEISKYLANPAAYLSDPYRCNYEGRRVALERWFDARKAGIARAMSEYPNLGVTVVDAIEIASYRMIHGSGIPYGAPADGADALHGIVPRVQPAYVLYSAWETTGNGRVDQDLREISEYLAAHSPNTMLALGEFGRPGQAQSSSGLDAWILHQMVRAAMRAHELGPLPDRAWLRFIVLWQAFHTVDDQQQLFSPEGAETNAFRAVRAGAPAPSPAPSPTTGKILAVREVAPDRAAVFCDQLPDVRNQATYRYFELYGSFPTGTYTVTHQRHRDDGGVGGREARRFRGGTDERATEDHG